jgi:hypothetical protein
MIHKRHHIDYKLGKLYSSGNVLLNKLIVEAKFITGAKLFGLC